MKKNIELFAGAGGLALGLEKAGFETIGLIENNKSAAETLRRNRPSWNVIQRDIEEVVKADLPSFFQIAPYELDLLSGGYPCQAFSYAGKKEGFLDTRGTMFYYYIEVLRQLMPKMFLVENVKGLVTHDKGRTFQIMRESFEEIGYSVEYQVLNAKHYGVAQDRQRIFLVGIRNDLKDSLHFEFPSKMEKEILLKDVLKDCPDSEGASYSAARYEILKQVPSGGNWRDLKEEVARGYLKTMYDMPGGKTGIAKRLSFNKVSPTILCSPINKQTERCHPIETRPLTVRESARIQSFPDEWEFIGSMAEKYKQIGNAVPVNLAYAVGTKIYECLDSLAKEKNLSD